MPVNPVVRGRRYTERGYLRIDGDPSELTDQEVELLRRNRAALERATTVEEKLRAVIATAEGQLTRRVLPLDVYDPIYSDEWMLERAHRSLDWYAVHITAISQVLE
jgi:hypothetical protein